MICLAADAGTGTSSVAASLALLAAQRGARRVWLQELALGRNALYRALSDTPFGGVGPPGLAYRGASPGSAPFVRRSQGGGKASAPLADEAGLLCVHPIGDTRAVVSRLRTESLAPGERIAYRHDPAWWRQTRALADWILVDAPDTACSDAAFAALPEADAVLVVARADYTRCDQLRTLTATLREAGAPLLGLVVNAVAPDALRLSGQSEAAPRRRTPQAGQGVPIDPPAP